MSSETEKPAMPSNFIKAIIEEDMRTDKWGGRVHTRFPPEPNGYLHIGHAKSICLNFGLAREYGGQCNLRFDDTNPTKEDVEYVDSIKADVHWLGFDWEDRCFYASDYFERLFECAVRLIKLGKAYVDSLSADEIREHRGTLTRPGTESPYRNRTAEENLDLFMRMRAGEFPDGAHVLRAKIDMTHPNIVMRDPTLYRIRHAHHHRTGDQWCIYPMYDFTHCLSDSFEGVTHSLCTLEFENNRELYDWVLDTLEMYHPRQYEFARLNMTHVVLSKRKLIKLVSEGAVDGWDDPRMPTISGFRRRGYTPEAIRDFCERIGVARSGNSVVDYGLLEHCLREDLNDCAPRVMGVLRPLKLTIVNYPDDKVDEFEFPFHPEKPEMGSRKLPFTKELWIERTDFMENAPKKWFRLAPGQEVRLRYAYYVRCVDVVRDASGEVVELKCEYDPATKGGWSNDGRKVKGTLHWLSARHAVPAEFRLFDHLFREGGPADVTDPDSLAASLNPDSMEVLKGFVEPGLADTEPGWHCQFERTGYFCADARLTQPGAPVFNRTTGLRDTFAKELQKG
ncbi:Glutaminyl-tRNA synthetase [Desulfovibrio sp. X2]|uniref:glutamine--tRNA ligase/YqeY domain fusion protein n=1 Tax=Desulfovibrio sp. X2 TaxID=941449 RepID=UPI000358A91C|nr:glutamine--tRNA ligase/YqeY domain fusion protein [Desulfovibrio sp. X2]EPR41426.1 Glutaminyl-tRNA synthetase [Desulfovibrio sp. X2]